MQFLVWILNNAGKKQNRLEFLRKRRENPHYKIYLENYLEKEHKNVKRKLGYSHKYSLLRIKVFWDLYNFSMY
jgi:hypothetical protein